MAHIEINVHHLGPIRNARIELRPFTLFTGESGLGKSYLALACFYLYDILTGNRIDRFFTDYLGFNVKKLWNDAPNEGDVFSITLKQFILWCEKDVITYISQLTGNPNLNGNVAFNLGVDPETVFTFRKNQTSQEVDGKSILIRQLSCNDSELILRSNGIQMAPLFFSSVLSSSIRHLLFPSRFPILSESVIFPPSRGAIMDCVSRPLFRAGIYDRFYDFKEKLLSNYFSADEDKALAVPVRDLASKAIKGDLILKDSEVYYKWDSDHQIPLSAAASSIKELAPYLLWLSSPHSFGNAILFEEPEAHLHPSRQMSIADTFGYILHTHGQLIVTTHSDYLLKRINQLCRLDSLMKEKPDQVKDLLKKFEIDSISLINPNSISAYFLQEEKDGFTAVSRIDSAQGVAFTSFEKAIDEEFDLSEDIESLEMNLSHTESHIPSL